MRKGNNPALVFTRNGNLVAIATGSDATAEHENGIDLLLETMTSSCGEEQETTSLLKKQFEAQGNFDGIQYPDLAESRRISKLPKTYQFIKDQDADGQPQAWLGVCSGDIRQFGNSELAFPQKSIMGIERDLNLTAAWSDRDFGIRVRGAKYVKALMSLDAALKAGDVMFGGLFFKRSEHRLSGLILVNRKLLSAEDKERLQAAQRDAESRLRLAARDDSRELLAEMRALSPVPAWPGFLRARWTDKTESDICYVFNPSPPMPAEHYGPYSREQLLDWAKKGYSYQLTPEKQTAEAA